MVASYRGVLSIDIDVTSEAPELPRKDRSDPLYRFAIAVMECAGSQDEMRWLKQDTGHLYIPIHCFEGSSTRPSPEH